MTKEEFISAYPVYDFTWLHWLLLSGCILLILLLVVIIAVKTDNLLNSDYWGLSIKLGLMGFAVAAMVLALIVSRDVYDKRKEWRSSVFTEKYLANLPVENFEISGYKIDPVNGKYHLLSDTLVFESPLDAQDVKLFDPEFEGQRGLLKAKVVKGLSEFGIFDDFYEAKAELPKRTK